MRVSQNFAFLKVHSKELVKLASQAESYFVDDPNTCLIKLRQYGELLAQLIAARVGLYQIPDETQFELLKRLEYEGAIAGQVRDLFHEIRKFGNDATHSGYGNHRIALSVLKYCRSLGIWFHQSYGRNRDFKPGAFIPPSDPKQETDALREELAQLRQEYEAKLAESEANLSQLEIERQKAAEEAELRQLAEELLNQAETQAEETARKLKEIEAQAAIAATAPKQEKEEIKAVARELESKIDLDESETRLLIDRQLRDAGWEVDSENLTYKKGARPQRNRNLAIAEFPTSNGRADYALFVGRQLVAFVEAKRKSKDVYGAIDQAKRYSAGYCQTVDITLPDGSPWDEYKVPFVFATNGREYLKQLETKSGIWFCDLRRKSNLRRSLRSWYSPEGLIDTLKQDIDQAEAKLAQEGFNYNFELRDYQIRAIEAVEASLATGKREILLAMATGTGKTKTCIALVYRLLKNQRFRRILFLVDRTALGEQAINAFKDTKMEQLQNFADIYEVKELKDKSPERETKVHIATVQSFVRRLMPPEEEEGQQNQLTADLYDCIVVDECHRGYLLDRELSDAELTFRDFNDYVSKYRMVIDHFDAVRIGLTATPALHTTEIFGEPVYKYSYREAVIDGWLIDHEPPYRIVTQLSEEGITWNSGDQIDYFDPATGQIDSAHAPDEITVEVEQFNRRVITESFNRVVCEQLAQEIDPELPGKTLIFCVNNEHAILVEKLLKDALRDLYGSADDDIVKKITGDTDKPLQAIRKFKNEVSPKIAVTVDLLTTGIDVPEICNLVFLRRVNSRILYEQMLGRATRRCDEINKEVFRIFDAVNLYEAIANFNTMKPVAVIPKADFKQLFNELDQQSDPKAVDEIVDQLIAKLQRKKRSISDENNEMVAVVAGMEVPQMVDHLRQLSPMQAREWLRQRKQIAEMLDRRDGGRSPILISYHEDELRAIERGYGKGEKPEDYLESFKAYIEQNLNKIPALILVTQRPRELTRQVLRQLQMDLAEAGYMEKELQSAYREATNEDIAASIIGFIRQAAIGDALEPYSDRVNRAMKKMIDSRRWTNPQRKWLERIGKQLEKEYIVDREALDRGAFAGQGGFARINKIFGGEIEAILAAINDYLWDDVS
jgi:type I restriction enzyme R subunit